MRIARLALLIPGSILWTIWSASAAVLEVPGSFSTIQSALDSAAVGDTVLVAPGTYHELLIIPPHDITLASRYMFTGDTLDIVGTVLDGQLEGTVITVTPGEQLFHLNGFIVTGGWAWMNDDFPGGGLWFQPEANVDLRNVVFTGNGSEWPTGFGAAVMGGLYFWDAGAISLHNVQITDNNHVPGSGPIPYAEAFFVTSSGRIEISNLNCNGAGLNDAAIFLGTTDSLFADTIFVNGYQVHDGIVAGFTSSIFVDIKNVRIIDNHSCGAVLLSIYDEYNPNQLGHVRLHDIVIEQNSDTCANSSSWEQIYVSGDFLDAENVTITNNRISTNYVLEAQAQKYGLIRNMTVENNTIGSVVDYMPEITGSIASFANISLDSASFIGNTAHLPSGQNYDYNGCPLLYGSYFWTENYEVDSMTWRNVSFRDNFVYDHTNPATNHDGLLGRAVYLNGFAHGTFLFDNCEWVNNRVNMIAPEVDLFPGPRNVGSTVEVQGDHREVGTNVIFNNCLFQDNDDGGLYAADIGCGLMQNCRFLRNNRFAAWFYSNNDDAFVTVRNTWFHGTNMQEYYLPYPQYQGILNIHGRAGALIENSTFSSCSTSFAIALGYTSSEPTVIKNATFSSLDYDEFVRVRDTSQPGYFSYCISQSQVPGEGNLVADPLFDSVFGAPYLSSFSPAIDAGNPNPTSSDLEDPTFPGFALWPSRGTLRNDIGVTGGPFAMAPDTSWATLVPRWEPRIKPQAFTLGAPWPNPFNPVTHIPYTLLQPGRVAISVHNLLGQRVALLTNGLKPAGTHAATFDAAGLSSGIYLITLEAAGRRETRTVTLLR